MYYYLGNQKIIFYSDYMHSPPCINSGGINEDFPCLSDSSRNSDEEEDDRYRYVCTK